MLDPIHAFYLSQDYKKLSIALKVKSGGRCARCGGVFDIGYLRTHHIEELTLDNIHNPRVTLNPDNIEVICHDCHNDAHHRFGARFNKSVYIVHGAPCAGKSVYVEQVATRYDLVVDLDRIHQAICVCSRYDKPDATKSLAFDIRDLLYDRIRYRRGKWECAYIIGCLPIPQDRERLAGDLGAELIHIATSKEECLSAAARDAERRAVYDATVAYINDYFDRYIV